MANSRKGRALRLAVMLASSLSWDAAQATQQPARPADAAAAPAPVVASATGAAAESTDAPEPATAPAKPAAPHGQHAQHRTSQEALEARVDALGDALALDPAQKSEVRKILMIQREQLRLVWNDPSRTSADRIGASQSINLQTEDRIRSILTEAQRKQYIASKPTNAREAPEHGLDYWMGQMQGAH